jgi:hypothetical protein
MAISDCCGSTADIDDVELPTHWHVGVEYADSANRRFTSWGDNNIPDSQSWTIVGNEFGAGKTKLKNGPNSQSDCCSGKDASKPGKDAGEPSKVFVVASDSLFWCFLFGTVSGLIMLWGGSALLWRLWGV